MSINDNILQYVNFAEDKELMTYCSIVIKAFSMNNEILNRKEHINIL